MSALVIGVITLLLVPLAWTALIAALRAFARDADTHESAERAVLVLMLAPIVIGAVCFAWSAAPLPYVPPPLLPDAFSLDAMIANTPTTTAPRTSSFDWIEAFAVTLAILYALGFAWNALRLCIAQARIARIAARAAASDELGHDVALTDEPVSAFLAPRGRIILPRGLVQALPRAQIALIIAHERGHKQRGDDKLYAALAWLDAVLWFNTFVRAQTRRCRLAAELACDAAVTSGAPHMRRAYAQALIAALKHPAGDALQCAPAVFSSWIMGDHRMRIARIMSERPQPRKRALWGVCVAACLLAAPVSVVQLAIAQPSVAEDVAPVLVAQQSVTQTAFSVVPVSGRISSRFGERRDPSTGLRPIHNGMDFAAPEGTPIVAPAAGRVVRVAEWENYGKLIDIDHGGGLTSRYAHLSAFDVREGDSVSAGQPIGRVGATGLPGLRPHLHFEVWRDGARIDPESVLP